MNKTLKNQLIHYIAEFYRLEISKLGHDNKKLNQYFEALEEMDVSLRENRDLNIYDALSSYFHGPLYNFLLKPTKKYATV